MNHVYTTLFDSAYLARGLVMIDSLLRHSHSFIRRPFIHVLAIDDDCFFKLQRIFYGSEYVQVTRMNTALLALKRDRTHQEFCWMLASVFTQEITKGLSSGCELTYLDADLMFFDDPELIHDMIGEYPIAIVPHRFHEFDEPRFLRNGRYNVSWVTFAGEVGRECLYRWAAQCIDWCYYRNEDGKFGDQKYLDEWESLYPGKVKVLDSERIAAPWNIYRSAPDLIFYHYSGFKEDPKHHGEYHLAGLNWGVGDVKANVYQPYINAYERTKRLIKAV